MRPHFYFVTRLYSGLFETIRTGQWQPTGIPTITELAERVSGKFRTTWTIICKNEQESAVIQNRYTERDIHGIYFRIFPYRRYVHSSRINLLLNDILALAVVFRSLNRRASNIAYCDRSNILAAALIKSLTNFKVVIRILGLYPDQKDLATRALAKIIHPLSFVCYKIKFDLAVGTQDGSGIEFFLYKILNRHTRKVILLNGVDMAPSKKDRVSASPSLRLLFVGKLIEDKGIWEFLRSVAELKTRCDRVQVNIIGKGPLKNALQRFIETHNLTDRVHLRGSLGRQKVKKYYSESDIYISLNKLGNLSNTVLEGLGAGLCTIILHKDPVNHTDEYTENAIPQDVVVRVERHNMEADLTRKLCVLISEPQRIADYAARVRQFAPSFLWSWQQRISYELKLIEGLMHST